MEIIAGIDLGTTNSEIAIYKDGKTTMLSIDNDPVMPSCVALDGSGEVIVGRKARNQLIINPGSTIRSIKRKMGQQVTVPMGDRSYSPEEISALILRELKSAAEKELGCPINKAVITVPAYFNDNQRRATKDAGALAGLDVVRIINEPTAAALAYESGHEQDQRVLVYDLGGGTFDVSVVVVENGVVEVKSSFGDTQLGGDDFDNLLIDMVAEQFLEKHSVDLRLEPRTRNRLWNALEQAKITLSDSPFALVHEEYIHENLHLEIEIARIDYEELITPLIDRTVECIHKALRDAAMLTTAIDRVLLVGGASRTPLVHKMIKEHVGIEPEYSINPELIVAMGAAIQAGVIAGEKPGSVLVDITAHTFGTSALKNDEEIYYSLEPAMIYVPIIHRNTPLPARKSEVFYTMADNQEMVEVKIYEGENTDPEENVLIGKFSVEGLGRVKAGNPILLNFDLDLNGILNITATERKSGLTKIVRIDTKTSSRQFDLQNARKNLSEITDFENNDEPIQVEGTENNILQKAKKLRSRAEKLIKSIDKTDADEVQKLLHETSQSIASKDFKKLKELSDSLEDMLFYLEV
jgi:molecular chaperone DnaK